MGPRGGCGCGPRGGLGSGGGCVAMAPMLPPPWGAVGPATGMRPTLHARAVGHHGAMKHQERPGSDGPELAHDEAGSRYELRLAGRVAGKAEYRREGDRIRFTHTEIDPGHEGQGLASRLAAFALDDVKTRGLKAVPQCRFIAKYIAKNEKEYGALVA